MSNHLIKRIVWSNKTKQATDIKRDAIWKKDTNHIWARIASFLDTLVSSFYRDSFPSAKNVSLQVNVLRDWREPAPFRYVMKSLLR